MAIVASADFATAESYKGKSLSAKFMNKKHKVYLKLLCDDFTLKNSINLAKVSNNILYLEYQGMTDNVDYQTLSGDTGVNIIHITEVGNNFSDVDINDILEKTPLGVVPIVKLQDDFSDLKKLYDFTRKYPRVRYIGGNLFRVDGVNIGSYTKSDLDKKGIKYTISSYKTVDCCDILSETEIEALDIDTSNKPEREPKLRSGSKPKSPKKQTVSMFSGLINPGSVEF